MKRLLFITGGIHYPPVSGYGFRVYNLLKIYAQMFEVILIADSFNARNEEEINRDLASLTKEFQFVKKGKSYIQELLRRGLHPIKPRSVILMTTSELRSTIDNIISKYPPFDFIHIERLRVVESVMHILREKPVKTKFILDLDDWESKTRFREAQTKEGGLIKKFKRSIEPRRLLSYEKRVLPLFDWVYVCSKTDREGLSQKLALNNVVVVPNGITLLQSTEDNFPQKETQESILLYIGSLGYGPNIDAIEYFVKNIFPLILEKEPNVQFWIAGNTQWAPASITGLNSHPAIKVFGFVENLKELYQKASVFVVPLRLGGGTRIKILEAASYKKAIVSTKIGCEGLDFQHEKSIWIADNPEAFANACCNLLKDSNKNMSMGQSAYKIVENKYQWSTIGKQIKQIILNNCETLKAEG